MSVPLFSVLIPSRNRLELLQHAVDSILRQGDGSFEIVISDNYSLPGYHEYVQSLNDARVRLIRSEEAISVTSNWNLSLNSARGEYVIMLGDDDALAPEFFKRNQNTLNNFDRPDLIYSPVYQYAYPGVVPTQPDGYLLRIDNSSLFRGIPGKYWLDKVESRRLGRRCLAFHHDVSFNAQHFIYRRDWIKGVSSQEFYKSNYPDYFTCFLTFLLAPRILVDTNPSVIVGISPRSYGFYHLNNRADEGAEQFLAGVAEDLDLARLDDSIIQALKLPGNAHTRSWLVAALAAAGHSGDGVGAVDLRRYRRIQAVETATAVAERRLPLQALTDVRSAYPAAQRKLADMVYFSLVGVAPPLGRSAEASRLRAALGVYLPVKVEGIDLGEHSDIGDAVAALERHSKAPSRLLPLIAELSEQIERLIEAAATKEICALAQRAADLERGLEEERVRGKMMLEERGRAYADVLRERDELVAELIAEKSKVAELETELWSRGRFGAAIAAWRRGRGGGGAPLHRCRRWRDGSVYGPQVRKTASLFSAQGIESNARV